MGKSELSPVMSRFASLGHGLLKLTNTWSWCYSPSSVLWLSWTLLKCISTFPQSPISTILFRIPMDVSQLDKSDSESESDWWTFHTHSQQKQEAEGLIKTSSTLNCNHMPSIIYTSHQMQTTFCKGYPSDVRFSVFHICEVTNIRFWLWQFCFFF